MPNLKYTFLCLTLMLVASSCQDDVPPIQDDKGQEQSEVEKNLLGVWVLDRLGSSDGTLVGGPPCAVDHEIEYKENGVGQFRVNMKCSNESDYDFTWELQNNDSLLVQNFPSPFTGTDTTTHRSIHSMNLTSTTCQINFEPDSSGWYVIEFYKKI